MITTHILDLSAGTPAAGVRVTLSRVETAGQTVIGTGVTDADGRLRDIARGQAAVAAGTYELTFETGEYFRARDVTPFHPRVTVVMEIADGRPDYHVPLLISPFGYTTYRGS
jgi:5-hydroxyisourate hydrolase